MNIYVAILAAIDTDGSIQLTDRTLVGSSFEQVLRKVTSELKPNEVLRSVALAEVEAGV